MEATSKPTASSRHLSSEKSNVIDGVSTSSQKQATKFNKPKKPQLIVTFNTLANQQQATTFRHPSAPPKQTS